MEKPRQANIEILRVFSMVLIIIGHYIIFGLNRHSNIDGYDVSSLIGSFNYLTVEPLFILSCVGTNIFVMITGYFLTSNETIRWKGILKTWSQTLFYSLLLGGICILTGSFSQELSLLNILLPVYSSSYWFVSSYIGLLLVAPFMAMISNKLDRRQYLILLGIGYILCSQFMYGDLFAGGHHIGWFVYLFFVAGFIKRFSVPKILVKHRWAALLVVLFVLFLIVTIVNIYSLYKTGVFFKLRGSNNHGMAFFLSVQLFICFVYSDFKGRWTALLTRLSPYCLGVYLIHMNPFWFREMWAMIIPSSYSFPIIIHAISICVTIYLTCSMIDFIRSRFFIFLRIDDFLMKISSKFPQL